MFRRFFIGRYGNDQLNVFLYVLSIVLDILAMILKGKIAAILSLLVFILLVLAICRMLSRNIWQRQRENRSFLNLWERVKSSFKPISEFFNRLKDRNHRYFKCPNCKSRLRVPRGRGKITVTCPRCKHKFDKKS